LNMNEMNDQELHDLLKNWEAPATPPSLKGKVLEQYRKQQKWDWRRPFSGSLRVPVPIACLTAVLIGGLAIAVFMPKAGPLPTITPPPQIVARVVEVPVVRERIVTRIVYRNRAIPSPIRGINLREFQPVASLVPRIIKRGQNVDQN
jgi:hypothetical protein